MWLSVMKVLFSSQKRSGSEQGLPALPGVIAGCLVCVAGLGRFAGAHETVSGAVIGHGVVGFPGGFHRGDCVWNCGADPGVVPRVEAVDGRLDARHRVRGGRRTVENKSRGKITAVGCEAEALSAAPAESCDVQF